jgi:hypothetical protein
MLGRGGNWFLLMLGRWATLARRLVISFPRNFLGFFDKLEFCKVELISWLFFFWGKIQNFRLQAIMQY